MNLSSEPTIQQCHNVSTISLIQNNQHLEIAKVPIKRRMEKQTVLLTQWNKKEHNY